MDTVRAVDAQHEDHVKKLSEQGVRYVTAAWIDVMGRSRAKSHPVEYLPQLMAGFARYTPRGVNGIGTMDPIEHEATTVPDLDSLTVLPWDGRFAWMAADLWSDGGSAFDLCPRSILKRQIAKAAEMGFKPTLGIEPEFYVYRPEDVTEDGLGLLSVTGDMKPTSGYDVETLYDVSDFMDDALEMMRGVGLKPFAMGAEGGQNQFEIDFSYAGLLEMADRVTLFRLGLHQVAKKHGLAVTFMPKPFHNHWGSGAHFNIGMERLDRPGQSVLRSGSTIRGQWEWTPECGHFVAGILKHARALTALTNPLVNSYKRLTPRLMDGSVSWAPIKVAYGPNNRSCMIRRPENRPAIEVRNPDASANVYLAGAFLLASGLEGIEQRIDPGPEMLELASERDEIPSLPRTLMEAIEALEQDELAAEVFGDGFMKDYTRAKRTEWEQDHLHVSRRERADTLVYY